MHPCSCHAHLPCSLPQVDPTECVVRRSGRRLLRAQDVETSQSLAVQSHQPRALLLSLASPSSASSLPPMSAASTPPLFCAADSSSPTRCPSSSVNRSQTTSTVRRSLFHHAPSSSSTGTSRRHRISPPQKSQSPLALTGKVPEPLTPKTGSPSRPLPCRALCAAPRCRQW
jgi:hypothetical protein